MNITITGIGRWNAADDGYGNVDYVSDPLISDAYHELLHDAIDWATSLRFGKLVCW